MSAPIDFFSKALTQYLEVNGIQYAYRRFGNASGVPIIGFQHFTGTLDNWDPISMNGLAQEREVIIFDNTGVGNTGGVTPDNVAAMTQDAIAFIEKLNIQHFDILGFSLGGFIAQQLAFVRPDLVRKIIIVGSAPQGVKVLHSFPQLIQRAMQLQPAERFLFIFFTPTELSREKGMATLQRLFARTEDRDREASQQAVLAQLKAITAWGTDPVTINLSQITQPVLIIQGSNDEMMDSDNSYTLFKQLPDAILTYYPDSAHGSFYQYPDQFVNSANFFLNN
ncbi:alpha/beta hydrolase [Cytophagaceae bacterium DM2B3-1]|uniref:Alpha/beta hydrolase n=1 Tax=Xanthocytophaga flava TaxID=3048013 RepID=A0ABT7CT32_9BACT|nr:alpha/beta hydrolase [Xanthocytophaga flavus]MDJ1472741.1 alpha/beta hydrolase [Xanthocytophaga flavus]MDJ1496132.1 alpha/beta hydrolase [Xanthocytophaga flavus]